MCLLANDFLNMSIYEHVSEEQAQGWTDPCVMTLIYL